MGERGCTSPARGVAYGVIQVLPLSARRPSTPQNPNASCSLRTPLVTGLVPPRHCGTRSPSCLSRFLYLFPAIIGGSLWVLSRTDGGDAVMKEAAVSASAAAFAGSDAGRERILKAIFDETIFHSRVEVRCSACICYPTLAQTQTLTLTSADPNLGPNPDQVRCSACIWLTNLLRFAGNHPSLASRLPEIHEALGQLLGDGNDLTQEMASRGMSLVYQLGDEETRKQLVGALVGTLSGTAPRKRRAVKVEGDSKVFEDGTMGATPDGKGLSTYQVRSRIDKSKSYNPFSLGNPRQLARAVSLSTN